MTGGISRINAQLQQLNRITTENLLQQVQTLTAEVRSLKASSTDRVGYPATKFDTAEFHYACRVASIYSTSTTSGAQVVCQMLDGIADNSVTVVSTQEASMMLVRCPPGVSAPAVGSDLLVSRLGPYGTTEAYTVTNYAVITPSAGMLLGTVASAYGPTTIDSLYTYDLYQVNTFANGLPDIVPSATHDQAVLSSSISHTATGLVVARQAQIGPGSVIPNGTAVTLLQAGELYYMQVPIWL